MKAPIAIVCLTYLACIIVAAGLAQLQLVAAGLESSRGSPLLMYLFFVPFIVCPLIVASALIPAMILRSYRIRSWAAYLVNVPISAAFAGYIFAFNYGVADTLGELMVHIPKKGAPQGVVEEAPPFAGTLADALRSLPLLWVQWQLILVVSLIGLICVGLFWLLAVRRLRTVAS